MEDEEEEDDDEEEEEEEEEEGEGRRERGVSYECVSVDVCGESAGGLRMSLREAKGRGGILCRLRDDTSCELTGTSVSVEGDISEEEEEDDEEEENEGSGTVITE